jgi:hypothetical protein
VSRIRTFSEQEAFQTISDAPSFPCGAPGECRLSFNQEVVLLYWPPNIISRDICAEDKIGMGRTAPPKTSRAAVETITRVPFRGQDLYRLAWAKDGSTVPWHDPMIEPSIMTGSWELTSPTLYLAHRPITVYRDGRKDGGGGGMFSLNMSIETIRSAGIVALHSRDVFSRRPLLFKSDGGTELARSIANGLWRPEPGQLLSGGTMEYETKPFNFGHLQNPVPASVYLDARSDCWGEQTHCSTITDDSYRPRIFLANHVWRSIVSDDYVCELPTVVDPPIMLKSLDLSNGLPEPTVSADKSPYITVINPPGGEIPSYGLNLLSGAASPRPRVMGTPWPRPTEMPGAGTKPRFSSDFVKDPSYGGFHWTHSETAENDGANLGTNKRGRQTERFNGESKQSEVYKHTAKASQVSRDEEASSIPTEGEDSRGDSSGGDGAGTKLGRTDSRSSRSSGTFYLPVVAVLLSYTLSYCLL